MAEYGVDLSCLEDLDPGGLEITGHAVVEQAMYRRFTTRNGGLFYDPEYGLDLRDLLSEASTPGSRARLENAIVAQALLDERIEAARATLVFDQPTQSMTIDLELVDAEGPFELTLAVDAVTVELVLGEAA